MVMMTGTVVDGRIVVAGGSLIEGSTVMVLTLGDADNQGFLLGPEDEAALLASIQEAERGKLVSGEELLRELGTP